ncbi:MAG: hypothetical protein QOE90_302 [Thermoplasmata archaeon]|nr:hypothetical protein [Thermoplasmata archaeon]
MRPIEDHGLIGDCLSAALVAPGGRVVWWCAPRFDSMPACDAILGGPHEMSLAMRDAQVTSFGYAAQTNVLVTAWRGAAGAARVHDFMPYPAERTSVVRLAECLDGEATIEATMPGGWRREVRLRAGEAAAFAWSEGGPAAPDAGEARAALDATLRAWRGWAERCEYDGAHRDLVVRSLLALKAMRYAPTGAMVAAPTTSLPETLGGVRNWDYRFAWLRDTGFCMDAFVSSGYRDEARALAGWLLRTVAAAPAKDLRVLYTVEGAPAPRETHADLPGYADSRPVRFGNDAVDQFQLDAYGHVMECLHLWQGLRRPERRHLWPHVVELVERCCARWREPDHGIWELPHGKRQLTYSKVMAWVAVDRAIRTAEDYGLPAPLARWDATRGEIRRDVMEQGVDPETGAFTQAYGDRAADASNLRLAIVGFVRPDDARYQATLREAREQLSQGGFLLRYAKADGLEGKEGAFLACSFWLVEALALAGRRDEAQEAFDRLAALASPLGLYAEEYDPVAKRHLGNFPQAFTHAALVSAAWQLVDPSSTRERGAHEPAERRRRMEVA